jgi:hypothetical protein
LSWGVSQVPILESLHATDLIWGRRIRALRFQKRRTGMRASEDQPEVGKGCACMSFEEHPRRKRPAKLQASRATPEVDAIAGK